MSISRVFHKQLDKVFRVFSSKVFHSCVCLFVFCVFAVVICDPEATDKKEYILKSTKVIEAVPRALGHRHGNDIEASTALTADGKPPDPCGDRQSYEAIRTLHRQLDDDASGDIDVAESDEFLRDELKYENGYERHKEFHGDDKSISVDELWDAWRVSLVHNWTVDETINWLVSSVELPDYEHTFRNNAVDGTCLPRLAINSNTFLSGKLGIKDAIHRQKIALKAMDVVLFGTPKTHNYLKDAVLALSILVATGGIWFAYVQHKYSQSQMQKMMKDMELLQRAEDALSEMQHQLTKARQEQEIVNIEKQDLERRLQDEMKTSYKGQGKGQPPGGTDQLRVRELEEQLRTARNSLHDAERRLGARAWVASPTLQLWLQLTYELELKSYNKKKAIAEQQLQAAKEGCEKLKKKRSTFMGAFRITHGGSIDDVDDRIIQAKTALSEVTTDLQERMNRWKQIEKLCGVSIMQNPGISYIESVLRPPVVNGSAGNLHSGAISAAHSSSEGNLSREESPPPYAAGLSAALLSNIPPPPTYSRSSPSYSRKPNMSIPDSSFFPGTSASGFPAAHCASGSKHDILAEVGADDDDQILEADEDILEESTSPLSYTSYSGYFDAGRPTLLLEDHMNDVGSAGGAAAIVPAPNTTTSLHTTDSGSRDLLQAEPDTLSSHSESIASESLAASEASETCVARKISSSAPCEKKKKSSGGFVNALKNSFSSSNLSSFDTCDDDDAATVSSVDSKQKKKKLFSRLIHKKAKMM